MLNKHCVHTSYDDAEEDVHCAAAAAGGRLVYCCGNCSRSAVLLTRPFPLRSCLVCSVMDIAWKNHLIVHLNC